VKPTETPNPVATQRELRDLTSLLVNEFHDHLSAGTVHRCVARCCSTLLHSGSRDELVSRVETLAHARLESRTRAHLVRYPQPSALTVPTP
jgi:hypothetical protein